MSGTSGELSPLLGIYNADNVNFWAGRQTYPQQGGRFKACGLINDSILSAAVATAAGTAEQTLGTYSLPANALDLVGRRLLIKASFVTASNTNGKTCRLYFGTTVISTGSVTTSAAAPWLQLTVTKSGASTQLVSGHGAGGTTGIVNVALGGVGTAAITDTAAIVIKATGQDGSDSAGDITLVDFCMEYYN